MTSFLGVLLALVAIGVLPIVALVAALGLHYGVRRDWTVQAAGRTITVHNRILTESVYIDGVRVKAAVSHPSMTQAVLSCQFEGRDGRMHQLMASIQTAGGAFQIVGHVFVDGTFVGGDPLTDGVSPPASPGASPEPDDARWQAARQLVGGIATHGGSEAREAADRILGAIRQALDDLRHLDEVASAHRTVAEVAGDDADVRLKAVTDLQEERVRLLLSTLSDLHLATLARTGTVGTDEAVARAKDVLGKLTADAEVDRAVKERAEKVKAVQQKARERA